MRITRIVLNDFRGFPGQANFEFRLDGSNLLLFGENGSGKSSLFVALREFFDLRMNPAPFGRFRNVFTRDATGQPLTCGRVGVEFDDGTGLHTWDIVNDVRPHAAQPVADTALRFGAVDYRAMLKTNFVHESGYPNLFDLLVNGVLNRMPVLVAGGAQTTLGDLDARMRAAKPERHYPSQLAKVDAACLALNQALQNHLPQVVATANQILSVFGNIGVTFQLIPPPLPVNPPQDPAPANPPHLRYDRAARNFKNMKIDFVAQLNGHGPDEPQHFLNEARLSAIAISIYLAALRASMPPNPVGANPPAKVMLLDDVLIGLDMSNRQPILDVLTRVDRPNAPGFADWQVLLLTHDQGWYSLARRRLRNWRAVRLASGHSGTYDVPILYDDTSLIERAVHHLNVSGDERAAGVYLRTAFEEMIKSFCARTRTPVAYHRADEHPKSTNVFWQPICAVKVGRVLLIDAGLKRDVESARSNVANPLCHFGNSMPLYSETVSAISILRRLQIRLDSYPDKNADPPQHPRTALDLAQEACAAAANFSPWTAAVHLRSAFDDSVSRLAARWSVQVTYSINLLDFATQRLWNLLRQAPSGLATTHATHVAGIHAHSDIFLQELDPTAIARRNQGYFQSALLALLHSGTPVPGLPSPGLSSATAASSSSTTWLDAVP